MGQTIIIRFSNVFNHHWSLLCLKNILAFTEMALFKLKWRFINIWLSFSLKKIPGICKYHIMHYNMNRTYQIGIHSWIKKKQHTSTSLCKHIDICWFSIVKTVAPGQFLVHTKSFKIWYRFIFTGTVVWYFLALELRCSLCYMTITSYKRSSMYKIYGYYCSGKWCGQRASCVKLSKIDHQRK